MAPYEYASLPPPEAVRHTRWAPMLIAALRCIVSHGLQTPTKTITRKLVSDDFGRGFLLLLQFIHRCEKVKMISEQT